MPKKSARAYWKGFLRLSLVSIGVEIYSAVESKSDISFRQIHKPSGRRIKYQKIVQGVGEIDNSDIVKGYEVDTDTYVTIEPEEIDALKLESKKTIDLAQFVDADEIDYRYFEGYVVIRDALRKTGKVGLAQVTIAGREWLVAIKPLEDGMVMEMLRYAEELRDPADFFDEVPTAKPDKEMVDLAEQLIGKKSSTFAPEKFEDHYQTALKQLVQDKIKGRKIIAPHEEARPKGTNVVDLMEALKKSVGAQGKSTSGSSKRKSAAKAAPAKKTPSRSKKRAS